MDVKAPALDARLRGEVRHRLERPQVLEPTIRVTRVVQGIGADAKVEPVVTGQNVEVREAIAYPNPVINGYRLALRVKRMDESKPVELRAFLRGPDSGAISETWSYLLPPS